MDRLLKNIAFWALIVLAVLFFYKFLQTPSTASDLMDSIRFADTLRAGNIAQLTLPPNITIGGDPAQPGPDGKAAHFLIATPEYRDLVDDLLRQRVTVEFRSPRDSTPLTMVLSWLPILVMIGVWVYFMRTIQATRQKSESQPGGPIGTWTGHERGIEIPATALEAASVSAQGSGKRHRFPVEQRRAERWPDHLVARDSRPLSGKARI